MLVRTLIFSTLVCTLLQLRCSQNQIVALPTIMPIMHGLNTRLSMPMFYNTEADTRQYANSTSPTPLKGLSLFNKNPKSTTCLLHICPLILKEENKQIICLGTWNPDKHEAFWQACLQNRAIFFYIGRGAFVYSSTRNAKAIIKWKKDNVNLEAMVRIYLQSNLTI